MFRPEFFSPGRVLDLPELVVVDSTTKFEVLDVHAGDMGICVHLRHSASGTAYALKCIRPDLVGDDRSLVRFQDEMRVWLSASMCSLVAEAIAVVRVNEAPCVLSAWMEKGDLARALPHLNSHQKFEALVRIVRAVSWVHEHLGVIHRDLKPANILLDGAGLAYVGDWGLARPVQQAMTEVTAAFADAAEVLRRPDRTHAGSFVGTVMYAAPEQILGASDISFAADLYALGCIMFEFETGAPPFTGPTAREIANKHIRDAPPAIGGWFKRTPMGLSDVIARCLRKRPEERYLSYAQLEGDLLAIARKKGIDLSRCELTRRYDTSALGNGHIKQRTIFAGSAVEGPNGYSIVEFAEIKPFLTEAQNLIELGRHRDAEKLLAPYVVPEMIRQGEPWRLVSPSQLGPQLRLLLFAAR